MCLFLAYGRKDFKEVSPKCTYYEIFKWWDTGS